MQNLAYYRKYRPQDFSSVCGQETITRILKNQITTGRIGHAYLFSGIRGTGKTSIAKVFARAVNCEHPVDGNPCGECETCKALSQPSAMDIIEIDAASNRGVDEIRDLRETITYPPTVGKYKVYIIDETHMLTKEAFNALLKTLEEPPEHAIFLLATTEPAKLPATILSRCQRYNVRPIADDVIAERLKEICLNEGVQIEDEAITEITRRAGHSMRDALSLLDQCADLRLPGELISEKDVADFLGVSSINQIASLARAQADKDGMRVLEVLNDIRRQGKEDAMLLEDLSDFYKQLLYFKITGQDDPYYGEIFNEIGPLFSLEEIYRTIDVLLDAHAKLRFNALGQIITDTALLTLCTDVQNQKEVTVQSKAVPARNNKASRINRKQPAKKEAPPQQEPPGSVPFPDEPVFEQPPFEPPVVEPVSQPLQNPSVGESQQPNKTEKTTFEKPDLALFKTNIVNLAKSREESLLSMLFENAEYRMNRHGLFIIIEDSHSFMFHTPGFQEKVHGLVNEVMGRPVQVYPKLKSKYYEHFGKKEQNTQVSMSESPKNNTVKAGQSLEEHVKEVIGDPNIPYEKTD